MSLHWAMTFKTHGIYHITAEFVQTLTARLGRLIQCLVAGHLPDLKLDMREVFKAGLNPVLTAQMVQDAECTDLAVAMMSRIAVDASLVCEGLASWPHAAHILRIFCESTQEDS